MQEPDISVVIPTRDRWSACVAAVRSALEQTPAVREVIVVDDGSGDGTAEELAVLAAQDGRIRCLRPSPPPGGPGAARNAGLRVAGGEWVAFLDDDDVWLPGKLAAQQAALATADLVAADSKRTSGGRYFGERGADWVPSRADLLADNPIITSTAVVRRDVVLAAGGFPEARWLRGIEDYVLWLAISDRGGRIVVVDRPLVVYRDVADDRLSAGDRRVVRALARLMLYRWARRPWSLELARAAGNQLWRSWRALRA